MPHQKTEFIQKGQFYVWVETDEVNTKNNKNLHPQQLRDQACLDFLKTAFAYILHPDDTAAQFQSVYLPTVNDKPVAWAAELVMSEISEDAVLQAWHGRFLPALYLHR